MIVGLFFYSIQREAFSNEKGDLLIGATIKDLTSDSLHLALQQCHAIQSVAGLHTAIPEHKGDWYFTGNFPTPGGNRVANRAFVYWKEGRSDRAY